MAVNAGGMNPSLMPTCSAALCCTAAGRLAAKLASPIKALERRRGPATWPASMAAEKDVMAAVATYPGRRGCCSLLLMPRHFFGQDRLHSKG